MPVERKALPVYGRGLNVRDWLFVDDHCRAIWEVFRRGRVGATYAIGGGGEQNNLNVVHEICRAVSEATGYSASELEELIHFVADRPGHDLRYAIDSSRMKSELGWSPKESFQSGLRKTVQWYLEHTAWVDAVRTGAYRAWIERNYGHRR